MFMATVHFIKIEGVIRTSLRNASMFFMFAILGGCTGMMMNSLSYSMHTGESYSEIVKTLPPPKEGMGRLYIYRTVASTASSISYGVGIHKHIAVCDLDGKQFNITWESFFYVDLPQGQHEITCPVDYVKKRKLNTSNTALYEHTDTLHFSISNALDAFVVLDLAMKDGEIATDIYQPILVDSTQATKEMMELPIYKYPI